MLQHVVRSTVIDAPIGRVWAVLRDFNSHDRWHDVVAESRIEGGDRATRSAACAASRSGWQPHPRAAARALRQRAHEHLLHRRRDRAVAALRRDAEAQAGDRRRPHLLALGVDLRDAARPRARARRDGGDGTSTRRASRTCAAISARAATGAAPAARRCRPPAAAGAPRRRPSLRRPRRAAARRRRGAGARPGEVRIRQRAIGVDCFDVYLRKGWIPELLPLPGVPGMEAVGTVVDVGANVSGVLPGDRVAYLGPVPARIAACAPCRPMGRPPAGGGRGRRRRRDALKGITADLLLRDLGHVGAGTRLLVHAAAGGVGLLVCSWARRLGAIVIGTVSSDEKARSRASTVATHPIVTRDQRFADVVQAQFGGVDVLVDGIGDAARDENFTALARRGHWISLGQASGALQPISTDRLVRSRSRSPVRRCSTTSSVARAWPSARAASGMRSPTER